MFPYPYPEEGWKSINFITNKLTIKRVRPTAW